MHKAYMLIAYEMNIRGERNSSNKSRTSSNSTHLERNTYQHFESVVTDNNDNLWIIDGFTVTLVKAINVVIKTMVKVHRYMKGQ